MIRRGHRSGLLVLAAGMAVLAVCGGCASSSPVGTALTKETRPPQDTTASQIYNLFYSLKTNSMAAALRNQYPPQRVSDNCQAFLNSLNQVSADLEFRLEFEAFVRDLFLVDSRSPGGGYGCRTNSIYQNNLDENGQGAVWVLPIGPANEKAVVVMSNVGPLRTTIMLFDDPLHSQLIYDSYGTPGSGTLYYLCGVEVVDRNHFRMHEACWLDANGELLHPPRTFLLSINNKVEVDVEVENSPQ
jgi:hypothetical protein